jgi:hypothetical protein
MTEIIKVVVNGKEKAIEVKDGLVLVICGTGPDAGAFYKKIEDCSNADFAAAEDFTPKPWGDSLDEEEVQNQNCKNIGFDTSMYKVDNSGFDSAVDFLCRCSGEDFLELVKYAKKHNNTFWHCVSEVADVINADDAYCSAIIKLSRSLGESVENKAFELFNEAIEKDEYDFIEFWKALQTINYFCN